MIIQSDSNNNFIGYYGGRFVIYHDDFVILIVFLE